MAYNGLSNLQMQMKDFMCARHVPKKLAKKITTFYTMAARHQVLEDKSLTDALSVPLQTELMLFLYRKTLEKVPFFQVIICAAAASSMDASLTLLLRLGHGIIIGKQDFAATAFLIIDFELLPAGPRRSIYHNAGI